MDAKIEMVIWVIASALLAGVIIATGEAIVVRTKRRQLTSAGLYPKPGAETDEDVQRLLSAGQEDMAVRCYQAIHRVNYRQAREKLQVTKPGDAKIYFLGLAIGIAAGVATKHIAVGVGLGLLLGRVLGILIEKKRAGNKR